MSRSENGRSPVWRSPRLGNLRTYWVIVFISFTALWPFSGLTIWHFLFFGALSVGIYVSYLRYVFPLIVYFSMILLYWVIVPILQGNVGVGYYTWRGDVPDFGPAALAFVATHLLGIVVGYRFKKVPVSRSVMSKARFSFLGVAFVLVLILSLIAIIGFKEILLPRVEQGAGDAQNYLLLLRNIAKLLPAFLFVYFVLESENGLGKNTRLATFFALALCLVLVSNPVNTSRFLSLFGLVVIVIAYMIKFSRLKVLAWALATTPVYAIFLLGITSSMRSGFGKFDLIGALQSLQSLEFSSYSVFLDAMRMDEFAQHNYLFSHLLILIPRSLWPGKADSIGIYVAENSGYVFHNVGLMSFFNAYADFGFIGLFSFSLVFGVLVKNLNPVFECPSFRCRRFMYGIIFTGTTPMFFRGDLSTAMLAIYAAAIAYEAVLMATRFRLK